MVGALAAADALDNRILLILAVGRNQNPAGLADDLLGRIAEKPRRAIVPTCDRVIETFADDRIVAGLDDGGKPLRHLLVAFALGDVHEHVHRAHDLARRIA